MKNLVLLSSASHDGDIHHESNTLKFVKEICPFSDYKVIDLTILTIIPYRYNHEGYRDHFLGIVRDMVKADNIIFATPVYWYSMSGIMKNFFDRFTDLITVEKELGRALKGKNTYLISTGSSPILPEGFEVPFRLTSEYFEMNYKQSFYKMVINE